MTEEKKEPTIQCENCMEEMDAKEALQSMDPRIMRSLLAGIIGSVNSEKKRDAVRKNLEKANAAKQKEKEKNDKEKASSN